MTTYRIEAWQADSSIKIPQNVQIWKPCDQKWRHNDNGKMRTSSKPNKLFIIRKVLMRAIQNVLFIEFESLCQKLWAFMSNFGIFYDARSPNMAMSCDPRSKFRKKLLFPNSAFNIGESCKSSSRKALYFRSYQPKTSRGVENTPPVLLGLSQLRPRQRPISSQNKVISVKDDCSTF